MPKLVLPARVLYALLVQQVKAFGAEAALDTCGRLVAQYPRDLFTLKGLLHCAKANLAEERRDEAQRLLSIAGTHPLATGEWVSQIENLVSDAARTGNAEPGSG